MNNERKELFTITINYTAVAFTLSAALLASRFLLDLNIAWWVIASPIVFRYGVKCGIWVGMTMTIWVLDIKLKKIKKQIMKEVIKLGLNSKDVAEAIESGEKVIAETDPEDLHEDLFMETFTQTLTEKEEGEE